MAKRITMDVARLLVRTSCQQPVDEFDDVMVNGEIFRLRGLEDSNGPMSIVFPQNIDAKDRDGDGLSEEEEDEDDEEEVEGLGRLMVEEVAERESEGDQHNLLALTPPVNALNVEDNLSVVFPNGLNEKENSNNNFSNKSGGKGDPGVGMKKKDSKFMKGIILLGQEEVVGGPQNTTTNHLAITGRVVRRFTQSEDVG
jgi:hypothetical protein